MDDCKLQRSSAESAAGDALHFHPPATTAAGEDPIGHFSISDDSYYVDSNCSTPYVSAPSSPGRPFDGGGGGGGYFYSAPASPMHFILSKASSMSSGFAPSPTEVSKMGTSGSGSFEFEFSARFGASCNGSAAPEIGSMSSADELFHNGQIRPMKLSTHLQRPQVLAPFMDVSESEDNGDYHKGTGEVEGKDVDPNGEDVFRRSRDIRLRNKSLRRRTRSLSPLRNTTPFDWCEPSAEGEECADEGILGQLDKMSLKAQNEGEGEGESEEKSAADETVSSETTPSASACSSRCSSAGRSSKRWVFLKDFLRSKSEGRSNHKFWTNISFSPTKEKKSSVYQPANNLKEKAPGTDPSTEMTQKPPKKSGKETVKKPASAGKPTNGVGKRRVPLSAHELHYTANRAQSEEMRKKTYLPYRQGLLGCLGFSSKSYGAMNGFARALNPVSSR